MEFLSVAAATLTARLTKGLADKLFHAIEDEFKAMHSDLMHVFFNSFKFYIESMCEKHSYFSSIVFPNQQLKLVDYYLPLTLEDVVSNQPVATVDRFPAQIISERKDILIVDQAGMGKSTILKFMFLSAANLDFSIPLFVEMRKLRPNESFVTYIFRQLQGLDTKVDEQLVLRLLERGTFTIFLDGYDEISDDDRERVTENIRNFKRLANKNSFVITSREQVGLAAFPDFYRVRIRPLQRLEADDLIRKYSAAVPQVGEALLEKLSEPQHAPIHEFLANPLLVSLLFKAYEFKHSVPLRKHIFYRQVFDALFENHDLSKDAGELQRKKLSGLDIYRFDKVMRIVGMLSLQKKRIEFSKSEFLALLDEAEKRCVGIEFNPALLLNDLVGRVPLFVVDGSYYRWSHKSIQEFFAALFLSEADSKIQEKVLGSMYASENASSYSNFLSLYADIDPKGFRHYVVPLILGEVLSERIEREFPGVSKSSVDMRSSLCFKQNWVIWNLLDPDFSSYIAWQISDRKGDKGTEHRDLFEESKRLLAAADLVVPLESGVGGGYTHINPIRVQIRGSRWNFMHSIAETLPRNVMSFRAEPSDRPSTFDAAFPPGGTAVDWSQSNPLNAAEKFDETNRLLKSGNPFFFINYDEAFALQYAIESEKEHVVDDLGTW